MPLGKDPTESLIENIKQFAAQELTLDLEERDRNQQFLEDNWQACARKGILGMFLPPEVGGGGRSLLTSIKVMEAFGYAFPDNGFTLGINGQMWAVQAPIFRFGSAEQHQRFLPKLIDGTWKGAHATTESQSGSNAFALQTRAEKTSEGYLLNGCKTYVGLGPVADLLLVFASTNPSRGSWGISAFIVDAHAPGVTLSAPKEKSGLRTSPTGDIEFADVVVPPENLLGREGSGAGIFNESMDFERSFIFTSHVGTMARQLDDALAFVRTREVGSVAVSTKQAVSNRIADMRVRLETARLFLYRAAELLDAGEKIPLHAAMAKLVISEALLENSIDAIRTHGGRGVMSEFGVERGLRDNIGGVIYSGTSDIQRNVIAGILGLHP